MKTKRIRFVLPGEEITEIGVHCLGISQNTADIAGFLTSIETGSPDSKKIYFIDSKSTMYTPQKDDIVIGKIITKTADFYRCDLGQSYFGYLPALGFPNVSRRNKPELNVGEFVICRVQHAHTSPVLFCDSGCGKIDGFVFDVPVWKVRKLLLTAFLSDLGKKYRFKIGLGMNGKIFIQSENLETVHSVLTDILNFT